MNASTVKGAFQKLRTQFSESSHQHPGLHHFWLVAVGNISPSVLERTAKRYGPSLLEVTRWPRNDGRIEHSCFCGKGNQLDDFKPLAQQARSLFVQLVQKIYGPPIHAQYNPCVAWTADLYVQANTNPSPLLGADYLLVSEWPWKSGRRDLVFIVDDGQSKARLLTLESKLGEPLAIHCLQSLTQDVFTASAAMIDAVLTLANDTADGQPALNARASDGCPLRQPGAGAGGAYATQADQSSAAVTNSMPPSRQPCRPTWVNEAELIGPCGHEQFANLMGVSSKHLYRLLAKEQKSVWKERGATARKFYFYLRDPVSHRRLREAFERSCNKKN